ncbi:hypothetical protein PMAYCL1PPCAC_12866, partial [Pristionchus mayeri]
MSMSQTWLFNSATDSPFRRARLLARERTFFPSARAFRSSVGGQASSDGPFFFSSSLSSTLVARTRFGGIL